MRLTKRAVAKVAKIPVTVLDDNIKNLTDGLGIKLPKRRKKYERVYDTMNEEKFILDACCGGRMFWFNKKHPNTTYIDIRRDGKGVFKSRSNFEVQPDIKMDFRDLKFPDKSFKLVVWDPPHMKTLSETSQFRKKFGSLNAITWQKDLTTGFNECWRVLEDYGVLIFKWNEEEIKLKEVLENFSKEPLFGHTTGSKNKTHWLCFMKISKDSNS